jgi:hypothetical protein
MNRVIRATILLIFVVSVEAADPSAAIRTTFIEPWAAALKTHDLAKLRPFLHPAVAACETDANREYFDSVLAQGGDQLASGPYRIAKLAPVTVPAPLFGMEEGFAYPIQPTYEMQLQFESLIVIRYLAPDHDSWYEVFPCPNDKGMAMFHQAAIRREQQRQKFTQLAAELKDPLLGELKDLLAKGQKIDAIHAYQRATGADLTTAHGVVELIEKRR